MNVFDPATHFYRALTKHDYVRKLPDLRQPAEYEHPRSFEIINITPIVVTHADFYGSVPSVILFEHAFKPSKDSYLIITYKFAIYVPATHSPAILEYYALTDGDHVIRLKPKLSFWTISNLGDHGMNWYDGIPGRAEIAKYLHTNEIYNGDQ